MVADFQRSFCAHAEGGGACFHAAYNREELVVDGKASSQCQSFLRDPKLTQLLSFTSWVREGRVLRFATINILWWKKYFVENGLKMFYDWSTLWSLRLRHRELLTDRKLLFSWQLVNRSKSSVHSINQFVLLKSNKKWLIVLFRVSHIDFVSNRAALLHTR